MKLKAIFTAFLCIAWIAAGLFPAQQLSDPHRIMEKHYEAIGGLKKLKTESSMYYEGIYLSGGARGTVKEWYYLPCKWRREVSVLGLDAVSGCNGSFTWDIDKNGKIKIEKNQYTLKRMKVERLLRSFHHMIPGSENFTLTFKGTADVGGTACYMIRIANSIDNNYYRYYINSKTFLLEKSIAFDNGVDLYTRYRDYREVNGILRSYHMEHTRLPSGGKYLFKVTRLVSNARIEDRVFEPPEQDAADFHFANGESAVDIPIQFRGGHIYVTVEVKGAPQQWILDTGANTTAIDIEYARGLGLQTRGKFKGRGAHTSFYYTYIKGPGLKLPGLVMDEQIITAIDLNGDYTGILGYDFLSRFVTRVDFNRQKVSFYHPDAFTYRGPGKTVSAPLLGKDFTLHVLVDGKYSGMWRVDLGASGTSFHYPYASDNNLIRLKRRKKKQFTYSTGVGGMSKLREVKFKWLELAGFKIKKPLINVPIQPTGGSFVNRVLAGNLGNSVLSKFTIYFDYRNQQIILEPGRDF